MEKYFPVAVMIIMIVRLIVVAVRHERQITEDATITPNPIKRRYEMKLHFLRRIKILDLLFNGHFIEVKTFYVFQFDKMPCLCFIGNIDVTRAYTYIKEDLKFEIVSVYQHTYFDHDEQRTFFNNTIFVLTQNRMIELGKGYVQILHTPKDYVWSNNLMKVLAEFRTDEAPIQTKVVGFAKQPAMN